MAKELKDFEVWHPPPPPDDEPLTEDPWRDDIFRDLRSKRRRLTSTGWLWLFVPGYLFLAKRLSFTLSEFLIWIIALGASSGVAVTRLIGSHRPWPLLLAAVAVLFHLHTMMFTAPLYQSRFQSDVSDEHRVFHILIAQVVALVILGFIFLW